jgi:formylmethanofuran dehydrogenase subunit E
VGRPGAWQRDPEHTELMGRVRSGEAGESERARFRELHVERAMRMLEADPDEMFDTQELAVGPPRKARLHASLPCASCGETAMETRIRRFDGQDLCQPCFDSVAQNDPVTITDLSWRAPSAPR